MPKAVHVTSGAASVQAVTGSVTLRGYAVRETAGAVATLILHNGTSAADPVVGFVELAADASRTELLPAVDCPGGVFAERAAGTTEIVLYV